MASTKYRANPVTAASELQQEQAGCRKQLTHTYTEVEDTPSLFPQLQASLRCFYYSYTIFLSDSMNQPHSKFCERTSSVCT